MESNWKGKILNKKKGMLTFFSGWHVYSVWLDPWVLGIEGFIPIPKNDIVEKNPLLVASLNNLVTHS